MPTECPYRIVLADDFAAFRRDFKRIIGEISGLEVVGEAVDGDELIEILNLSAPPVNMAIVDLIMQNIGGIEVTTTIKRIYPGMKVLILSMHREIQYVQSALSAGADGYLLKEDVDSELLQAIQKIRHGGVYISSYFSAAGVF